MSQVLGAALFATFGFVIAGIVLETSELVRVVPEFWLIGLPVRFLSGLLAKHDYTLILSDTNISYLSGVMLLAWVRDHRSAAPFVIYFGDSIRETIVALCPFLIMSRPFDIKKLQESVDRMAAKK